jgi:hypothetical protein
MKERWLSINKKCDKYLHSYLALGLEALAFFLAWYFSSFKTSAYILSFGSIAVALFGLDGKLFGPFLLFALVSIAKFPFFDSIPVYMYIMIVAFFLSFLFLIIKRKILGLKNNVGWGSIGLSFSLICLEMFISSLAFDLNFSHPYIVYGYFSDLIGVALVLIYFLFFWTSSKEHPEYAFRLLYFFNLMIISELITIYARFGSSAFVDADVGWGNKNVIAIGLEVCLPFVGELFSVNRKRVDAILILLLDYYFIFISNSRGGLITCLVLLPLLTFILVRNNSDNVIHDTFVFMGSFIACLLLFGLFSPDFRNSVVRAMTMGGDISGRDKIWEYAMMLFRRNPLFGSSMEGLFELYRDFFTSSNGEIGIGFCHNTFFTILASLGSVGLAFFLYHLFEATFSVLKSEYHHRSVLLFFLAVGLIHGMIDNTFFSIIYMLPYFFAFSDPSLLSLPSLAERMKKEKNKNIEK